jgi:hypothetical protein
MSLAIRETQNLNPKEYRFTLNRTAAKKKKEKKDKRVGKNVEKSKLLEIKIIRS